MGFGDDRKVPIESSLVRELKMGACEPSCTVHGSRGKRSLRLLSGHWEVRGPTNYHPRSLRRWRIGGVGHFLPIEWGLKDGHPRIVGPHRYGACDMEMRGPYPGWTITSLVKSRGLHTVQVDPSEQGSLRPLFIRVPWTMGATSPVYASQVMSSLVKSIQV